MKTKKKKKPLERKAERFQQTAMISHHTRIKFCSEKNKWKQKKLILFVCVRVWVCVCVCMFILFFFYKQNQKFGDRKKKKKKRKNPSGFWTSLQNVHLKKKIKRSLKIRWKLKNIDNTDQKRKRKKKLLWHPMKGEEQLDTHFETTTMEAWCVYGRKQTTNDFLFLKHSHKKSQSTWKHEYFPPPFFCNDSFSPWN